MRYEANYIGYELGNFLPPDYQGHEKCDVFFLLLQNLMPNRSVDTFCIKLGKSRFLEEISDRVLDCSGAASTQIV